jgi:preprotein translocase subunit SecY
MIGNFISKVTSVFSDSTLRNRVLFVIAILAVFRFLAIIPIPGVDVVRLEQFLGQSQLFGLLNVFYGGGLSNLSIVLLGVGPYITASIIMQLVTVISPALKATFQEEGEAGRQKFNQISRQITVPLAFLQGYAFLTILTQQGILVNLSPFALFTNIILIVAGSMLLMWLGELMTEFGIGNGISMIIFAGIVSAIPQHIVQFFFAYDASQLPTLVAFVALSLIVTASVVFITEAERPVPIMYARQSAGGSGQGGKATYLPIRVNQAGVIPIIFALSLLILPQMVASLLASFLPGMGAEYAKMVANFFADNTVYAIFYFVLVFVFTYFYTAVTFDPDKIAENLQKGGGFIPGVRPGQATAEHLGHIVTRTTFFGALFLAVIAVLPIIMQIATGNAQYAVGGTALLIVVSVVLDVIKKVDAQLSVREY